MNAPTPPDFAAVREQFLTMVESVRPDLHRYAARLVGSAIDGEDVVQDALAKAFYHLAQSPEIPPLRPWLFRITRNTAIDLLRRYERAHVDALTDEDTMSDDDMPADPVVLQAGLGAFMSLPVNQRSAVILKDVLGESLADIATHLGTTVEAVKALLVRGRQNLAARTDAPGDGRRPTTPTSPKHRALVEQYVALFNRRDWTGVQALLLEECRLDLVAKAQRQGKSVGGYFGRYAAEPDVVLRTGTCEGREVLGVFRGDATEPAYIVLLETDGDRVAVIRDFRYVPYIMGEMRFVPD
jgi:RNA polymerase sigma-70 factor (ECF subfamily)